MLVFLAQRHCLFLKCSIPSEQAYCHRRKQLCLYCGNTSSNSQKYR